MKHFLPIALAILGGYTCNSELASAQATLPTVTVRASQADKFVDSVGVNVHMSNFDSVYGNYPKVKSALLSLGVRHVRDALVDSTWQGYYDNHNNLGAAGIKSSFMISPGQSPALWQSYPSLMNRCFEAYENSNEMDNNQQYPDWVDELLAEMPALSDAVRGQSNSYPVYGPSLAFQPSFSALGNVSEYFDYGNLHNYPGGHNPESTGWGATDAQGNAYGSMAWQMDLLNIDSPGLPWVTTETGYTNQQYVSSYVSRSAAAVYIPRLVLNNWAAGATRTYIYELVSDLGEDYGLIDANWNHKAAFYALANLLNLLSDPGPSFFPHTLTYGIGGGDSNLHQALFQKRSRTYYLALWLGESGFNVTTRQSVAVTPELLTVQLPAGAQTTQYQWDQNGNITTTALTSNNLANLSVNDTLTILAITPAQ